MYAAFYASGSRGNDNLWRGVKLDKKRLTNVKEWSKEKGKKEKKIKKIQD